MPNVKNNFLYEDDDLIILDKPAGRIVNAAPSHSQVSLQEQLATYLQLPAPPTQLTNQFSSPEEIFLERRGMIHRLDKDTSGVLVWAKNPRSSHDLLCQFRERQVEKHYTCLVHGFLGEKTGRINLPLARKSSNRQIMTVATGGRAALTLFTVLEEFSHFDYPRLLTAFSSSDPAKTTDLPAFLKKREIANLYQGFSLLSVSPQTGRTHQIRAHLTHLHHPLAGDTAYLPRRKAKVDPIWCPRQFLHAGSLTFTHPTSRESVTFTAPLPPDLHAALQFLQK